MKYHGSGLFESLLHAEQIRNMSRAGWGRAAGTTVPIGTGAASNPIQARLPAFPHSDPRRQRDSFLRLSGIRGFDLGASTQLNEACADKNP